MLAHYRVNCCQLEENRQPPAEDVCGCHSGNRSANGPAHRGTGCSNKEGVAFKIVLANLATNADLDDSLFQFPASRVEQP
jgi:hypothetical protein